MRRNCIQLASVVLDKGSALRTVNCVLFLRCKREYVFKGKIYHSLLCVISRGEKPFKDFHEADTGRGECNDASVCRLFVGNWFWYAWLRS